MKIPGLPPGVREGQLEAMVKETAESTAVGVEHAVKARTARVAVTPHEPTRQ